MKKEPTSQAKDTGLSRSSHAALWGTALALAALVSYELTTRFLTSAISSRDDQLLGGLWSVVTTLFVLGYLLFFPFSSWGMAVN